MSSSRPHTAVTPVLQSKLPDVGTTIFTVMSNLARQHQAIDLGQGFPNFNPHPRLIAEVSRALEEGYNQYAPLAGLMSLREVVAEKIHAVSAHRYDPETEITITAGATQALTTAVLAVVHPGDEVIVMEPAYDAYIPAIRMAGGVPILVSMREPTQNDPYFRPDWQQVRNAVSDRTRAIMVNFPHNPTGAVVQNADLDALADITADTSIVVISDEVYEHIVFDGDVHRSMAGHPQLAARSFVVSSFGKTVHATGWKIGYCCAPAPLMQEFRRHHQFVVFATATPLQEGLARYLTDPSTWRELPAFYQAKRDYLANALSATRFRTLPSPGTFFLLADYSEVSDLPPNDFAHWLTKTHGVTGIPLSAFYTRPQTSQQRILRFCFAKDAATLDRATERLQRL